jgi:hypothetical protein
MIPQGEYEAQACKPLMMTKAKNGNDRVIVVMKITQGEQEGALIDFRGMLTGGATPITLEALKLMGYDGSDDESVQRNKVRIVIEHESFEGKTYPQIRYVNDPNRMAQYTELSAAEATAARARLKDAFMAQKQSAGKPVSPENEPRF